jgi:vacuolar protein sorting-associated protein 54
MFNSRLYQLILGAGATVSGNLKKITLKTLAITYRCLEFISVFIPIAKEFFVEKLEDKKANVERQFDQIAKVCFYFILKFAFFILIIKLQKKILKDFNQHTNEIYNKFIVMVDEIFDNLLSNYQVIAPVPSECFRSACSQIARIHQVVKEALSPQIVVKLFTEIHLKFKQKLAKRLKELNVTNDAGPKHGWVLSFFF